jgi:hypothetical protein
LNQSQKEYVIAKGFGSLFEMTLEGLETRGLFNFLLDLTDPRDMTIRCGPRKELRITKDVIHFITSLSNSGGLPEKFDWSSQVAEAASFRQNFHLSKGVIGVDRMKAEVIKGGADDQTMRCLFLVVFNRLLFCKGTHEITNEHIAWTKDIQHFAEFDWCQLIYNDLGHAVRKWHNRDRSQVTATVYGCSVVILVRPCIQSCIICFLSLNYIYPIIHYLLVTAGFPVVFCICKSTFITRVYAFFNCTLSFVSWHCIYVCITFMTDLYVAGCQQFFSIFKSISSNGSQFFLWYLS